MTTTTTSSDREPSEIELLLPWYAAGTLDREETQQVEAALAADPALAERYQWVRAELKQENDVNEAYSAPPQHDANRLFARIDALPTRRVWSNRPFNIGARIAKFLAGLSPPALAWSAIAAALVIVLQAGVLAALVSQQRSAGGYETASAPANDTGAGSEVVIRFQPQVTAAEIASFLEANRLSIVGGPSGGALYRVRVAPTKLAAPDLTRIVQTLQDDKVVGFIATIGQ